MKKKIMLIAFAIVVVIVAVCLIMSRPQLQKGVIDVWMPGYVFVSDPDETAPSTSAEFVDMMERPSGPYRIDTLEEFNQKVVFDDSAESQRKCKKYDDSFFEKNSLIIYEFQTSTSRTGYKVKKAYCDNQAFVVVLKDKTSAGSIVCMAFENHYVVAEVKDELVANCTEFNLNIR